MKILTFQQAEQFLALHIPKSSQQTFPGELGLKRAKYFLHRLGDPQEKLKIIHVAGTSGKGSTCYLIRSLLTSHGFKVGLHQSPHLTDVTERFQINGKKISQKKFVFYLNKIIPIINLVGKTFHNSLTYFEILVGLAYLIFYEKKVDYAVIETGLGGWFDATNVVERSDKLAVLTKIGLDHTNILGKNIEEITLQKAMIINEKSQAISIYQDTKAEKVIKKIIKDKQAKITFVNKIYHLNTDRTKMVNGFRLNLIGDYQKENAGLALAVVTFLSQRDGFIIDQNKIKKVFATAYFPGRFDIKKIVNKIVIFDGAHNPQKMEAFLGALIQKYPDKKFNFLLAFKKGKDYQEMLKIIILSTIVHKIIITSFFTENQDMINASEEPTVVGQQLKKIGFNNFEINLSLKKAWEIILNKKEPIVVTGSLYLVGEIFRLIKTNK
ncbi:hypothetical protein HZA75_00260 [Candidatus Roizmanbacteria bacterium]|nr:hypothetical protein [Candidatus Roizmanbacteria bacterium]